MKAGVLTANVVEAKQRLGDDYRKSVDDYLEAQRSLGRAKSYIDELGYRLRRLGRDCKLMTLADIQANRLDRWMIDQSKVDASGKATLSPRSRNAYRQAIHGFCEWCVSKHRLPGNPAAQLAIVETNGDVRKTRRALTSDELARLLYVAQWRPLAEYGRETVRKKADDINGRRTWSRKRLTFDELPAVIEESRNRLQGNPDFVSVLERRGRERSLTYKTALLTGLRRGELASITVGQVFLNDDVPHIVLKATDEKNRKGSMIPLNADLAADLRQWLDERLREYRQQVCGDGMSIPLDGIPAQLPPDAKLFDVPKSLHKALYRDLAAAGIEREDSLGRVIDVHAMRHTHCTMLFRSGSDPQSRASLHASFSN